MTVEIFDQEVQTKVLTDHRLPTEECRARVGEILSQANDEGMNYAKDQAKAFLVYQVYKNFVIDSVDAVKAMDYNKIDQLYAKAQEIRFGSMGGLDDDFLPSLSVVEDKEPQWFWQDRLLLNELNIIVGIQGTGKSYFTHWLAAMISTGRKLPGTNWPTPKGRVIFLSYEDPSHRIKRRVKNCGGDTDLIGLIRGGGGGRMFSLVTDLPRLRVILKKYPDTVMLVVDPVISFFGLGKADTNKGSDVRAVLGPLMKLADEFRVTVVGVMHLNKSGDMDPIHRIAGASAFGELARTVHLIAKNKNDHHLRHFSPMKNNEGPEAPGLNWVITESGTVEFADGQTTPTLEEQLSPHPKPKSKKQLAKDFLLETLKNGPMLAEEVNGLAENEGINHWTLENAKKEMGVHSTRRRDGDGTWQEGKWEWSIPPELTSKAS